jgi:hypothetical protein
VACHPVPMPLKHEWRLGVSLKNSGRETLRLRLGYAPLREQSDSALTGLKS